MVLKNHIPINTGKDTSMSSLKKKPKAKQVKEILTCLIYFY